MTDKESKAILIGAVSQAFPVGLYYLIGQGIADEETKQALKKALDGAEPKAKALVLDTLDALFPESRLAHEMMDKTLSSCGADYVKIAKALAYDLRPQTASECARAFMAEKHGPDAAALIVRFGADVSIYQDWLSSALASDSADEFVPASEIVISRRMKTPAIVAALRGRLVDSRKEMKQAAALALWSLNETDAAISSLVLQSLEQPMASAPYVALMRSDLRDPAMVVSLQNHLRGVAAGDLTDGWLTSPPEALDVLKGYRSAGIVDICLKSQLSGRTEDWALSLLTARAVMLGCREPSVVNVLNSQLASGAPGLIGLMADVKLSEAYGRMLVDDMRGAFETKLTSLYQDLTSDRAEASANYRLAIEYGLADLVEDADTEPEQQARHVAVAKKLAGLKDDPAPYFRAAAVRTQQIIFDAVMRKKLLLLRTHS
jgi:hypothetical protein